MGPNTRICSLPRNPADCSSRTPTGGKDPLIGLNNFLCLNNFCIFVVCVLITFFVSVGICLIAHCGVMFCVVAGHNGDVTQADSFVGVVSSMQALRK